MVNVLGPTSDSPSRLLLGPELPDVWPATPGPAGEPTRPSRRRRPSSRLVAGVVAMVALLLAGGFALVGTGAFPRGDDDGALDTGTGAAAAAAPTDAGLAGGPS